MWSGVSSSWAQAGEVNPLNCTARKITKDIVWVIGQICDAQLTVDE